MVSKLIAAECTDTALKGDETKMCDVQMHAKTKTWTERRALDIPSGQKIVNLYHCALVVRT